MAQVKVAVLGAGSLVFGPSVLKSAIVEKRLSGIELALFDPKDEVTKLLAGAGQALARQMVVRAGVQSYEQRSAALEGADFVICAAAFQRRDRLARDAQVIRRHLPEHPISESVGLAGIGHALRQIALIEEIAAEMRRLCPRAWLLNLSTPVSAVAQAAHEQGLVTVGFDAAALKAYGRIWKALRGQDLAFPFEPARSQLDLTLAGVDYGSWVIKAMDAETCQDLYPLLRATIRKDPGLEDPAAARLLAETGYLQASADEPPDEPMPGLERQNRLELLRQVAEGGAPWGALLDPQPWERPMDLVAAMAWGKPARFDSLNLLNTGQIPSLPRNVFVETPALATRVGPVPERVELPEPIQPLCLQRALRTDAIVQAARQRKRSLLLQAMELDPTISDPAAALPILQECLQAHADLLPAYE